MEAALDRGLAMGPILNHSSQLMTGISRRYFISTSLITDVSAEAVSFL